MTETVIFCDFRPHHWSHLSPGFLGRNPRVPAPIQPSGLPGMAMANSGQQIHRSQGKASVFLRICFRHRYAVSRHLWPGLSVGLRRRSVAAMEQAAGAQTADARSRSGSAFGWRGPAVRDRLLCGSASGGGAQGALIVVGPLSQGRIGRMGVGISLSRWAHARLFLGPSPRRM